MKAHSNWHKYIDLLNKKQVPQGAHRWYVHWVERFLNGHPGQKLQDISAADIEAYFRSCSRDRELAAWQLKQCVDALQLLFVDFSNLPVAQQVDWEYWKYASQSLEKDHATLAENLPPDEALKARRHRISSSMNTEQDMVLRKRVIIKSSG